MQCQCALGYRNGASASSAELCMGPAENGKHPCYPSPCNADWTACSQQSSQGFVPWRKESDHVGKRPVCNANIDVTNGKNYRYTTLEKCKEACIDTTGCDTISRYVYTGKTDTSQWHCWFYECGTQSTYQWEPQTSWGHGANKAVTYFLYTPGKQSTKVIHVSTDRIVNKTRYIDKVRWTNRTVDRIVNKTRYIDQIVNKTRYIDQIVNKTRYIDQIVNKTRYIDQIRWTNRTRYVDQIVNKTRYIDQIVNKTRYIDQIRWTNRTRYVDQIVNKTRYIDQIRWTNRTRYVDQIVNKTRYIDQIRWTNRTYDEFVNKTRYIDKTRWTNRTRYVDVFVNKTGYEDTIGPALLPEASADVSETPDVESNESSDDCAQWDTRDYVLILIIAVIAVAWCLKQTFEFFECRMPSKNAPATEEDIFPDAELPPMAWEVKVDDIVKD